MDTNCLRGTVTQCSYKFRGHGRDRKIRFKRKIKEMRVLERKIRKNIKKRGEGRKAGKKEGREGRKEQRKGKEGTGREEREREKS